jgi:hypothetical protein
MATKVQQFERESARRDSLEKEVQFLKHQLDEDREDLRRRHEVELDRRLAQWQDERNELLTIIQKECNQVFDRRRHQPMSGWNSHGTGLVGLLSTTSTRNSSLKTSPTSVATDNKEFFPDTGASLKIDTSLANGISARRQPSTSRSKAAESSLTQDFVPTTFSDIDSVLRETEELVASLM